jgi:hypothetical protein
MPFESERLSPVFHQLIQAPLMQSDIVLPCPTVDPSNRILFIWVIASRWLWLKVSKVLQTHLNILIYYIKYIDKHNIHFKLIKTIYF